MLALWIALGVLAGGGFGFVARSAVRKRGDADVAARNERLLLEAKRQALELKEKAEGELDAKRKELVTLEGAVRDREVKLDTRLEKIEQELKEIDAKRQSMAEREKSIETMHNQELEKLEGIAKLKKADARDILLKEVEVEFKDDLVAKAKEQKHLAQEEFDAWSRKILATAMERLASETTSEHSVAPVSIPSEDMKGRIIGKE